MPSTKLTNEQLSSLSPWDIASHLNIGYTGDMSPINHGGIFYDTRDWEAFGYASCVEFWTDPEDKCLVVQRGVINKPSNGEHMESVFRCLGIDKDSLERLNMHCQIQAFRSYFGIEVDGTHYPQLKNFNLDTWKERNIWKSIRGWIEALGE